MAEENHGFTAWLQDNARILLSIALVLFLLFAVYSYSKRTNTSQVASNDEQSSIEDITVDDLTLDQDVVDAAAGDDTELVAVGTDADTSGAVEGSDASVAGSETDNQQAEKQMVQEQSVMQKDGAITVSAGHGDGVTHLARRAAAEYASSNNLSLTAEQKVYVEDYLRKTQPRMHVAPGTSASFSNSMIATAVMGAQNLSDTATANIAMYAKNVSSFQ